MALMGSALGSERNPETAQAILGDDLENMQRLLKKQSVQRLEIQPQEQHELELLNADRFDGDAERKAEESARQEELGCKPDVEKPSKESRKDGKKGQQLEFARPGRGSETSSVGDPLAQLKTNVKKAKINAIWEQLNAKDAPLSSRLGHGAVVPSPGTASKSVSVTPGWMKNLGMAPKRSASESKSALNGTRDVPIGSSQGMEIGPAGDPVVKAEAARKEDARKVASAALAAAKAAAKAIRDGKIEINEVRDFAGEEVKVTKFVDPNSKAGVAARRKAETQVASSGLDALLEQIGKKQKLNILDKSRKDWGEFKEETGIEDELDMHIKSGDKYTDKVAFLQRSDVREYEKERDARLAGLSKRRSDSASGD